MSAPQQPYGQQPYGQQPAGQPGYGQPGFNAPVQGKSRTTVGLLNFFLGGFGAGDFYLGHKQMGIIKVVASIVLNIIYMAAAASESTVLFLLVLLVILGYSAFLIACMIMSFMGKWIYAADANGVPTV
ncbi:TM2 domain-containing protein [uncultured Actinomyces sp.]|uniref:TM2 domain-containing protein n=1 Tax=uncultured Actinomyces sp. TaxID=249061 RepID=UPI0026712507|nr:TM2 domain-containing protein [uncultured Actinomyces sp.]